MTTIENQIIAACRKRNPVTEVRRVFHYEFPERITGLVLRSEIELLLGIIKKLSKPTQGKIK